MLLQNKQPNLSISEKQDVPRYCPDITASQISMCKPVAETLDLSLLNYTNSNVLRKEGNHFHTHLLGINNSFADVIKAKINFDTKFLGFEAVLHKTSTASPSDVTCLCKICSNVMIYHENNYLYFMPYTHTPPILYSIVNYFTIG